MVVYVNFEEGVKRVVDNAKFYIKMLGKFTADTNINVLEAALTEGDMDKAYSAIHAIKGLAGNLSLTELSNQSLELENQIKAKSVNPEQVDLFKNVYSQTLAEVEKVIAQNG